MSSQLAKRQRSAPAATSSPSVDVSEFDDIVQELSNYDQQRETVIKRSRDIQKLSKQAIYSLHRGDEQDASNKLKLAETAAAELIPLISKAPTLRQGSYSNSIEEYAEAVILRTYLQEGRVAKRQEVKLAEVEEYLGGVLDFTGELNRIAIAKATVRDKEAVQRARDVVETLQGQFLRFDLRNGALRKKYDALKYTLKKLENTLYELSLTESGRLASKPEDIADIPNGDAGASEEGV